MTADDLTRLRAEFTEILTAHRYEATFLGAAGACSCGREWPSNRDAHRAHVASVLASSPTVAALIDRVERAERERDEAIQQAYLWQDKAEIADHERQDWKRWCNEAGAKRAATERELAALRAEGADERPCAGVHCGDGRDCPAGEGASEEDCQNAWADLNEQAHYE